MPTTGLRLRVIMVRYVLRNDFVSLRYRAPCQAWLQKILVGGSGRYYRHWDARALFAVKSGGGDTSKVRRAEARDARFGGLD